MLLIQAIKVKSVASAVIRQQFLSLRSSIDHGFISAKEGQAFAKQIADDMKQLGRAQGEGGWQWQTKPLSYFCPAACGCRGGEPHCPDACPANATHWWDR